MKMNKAILKKYEVKAAMKQCEKKLTEEESK